MFLKGIWTHPIFGKLACLLLLIFIFNNVYSQVQTQTTVTAAISSRIGGYLESLPVTYNTETNKKFPLIIFIHGKGEIGDGSTTALAKVTNNGIPRLIKQGKFPSTFQVNGEDFSFIVISPQITSNYYAGAPVFIGELLEYCKKKYRIDEERIYITGLSMGGGMTWSALTTHAATFAAAVPVCGSYSMVATGAKFMADSQLPVWCTHNSGDPTVSVNVTTKWYNTLVSYGATPAPKMTIFNSTSHDAWSKTYDPAFKEDGKNIYEWMLSYKRSTTNNVQPPVANAGADQVITLPLNSAVLDGSKSAASSGTIATYAWSKISGPAQGTIANVSSAKANVGGLEEGVYIFQLKVTDSNGASATDNITVTVKAAPLPPVANAGNAQSITLPASSVTLDGSKSTAASGTIKAYQWTMVSGPSVAVIANPGSAATTVSSLVEGTYTFQLKVTDSNNNSAIATVTVVVYAAPVPPVASAGNDQIIELPVNVIVLDGSKSTAAAGTIASYQWTKLSGPTQGKIENSAVAITTVTSLVEGTYEFQLKVTDSKGLNATSKVTITVLPAKVPPVARAGTDEVITLPLNEVTLNGSASAAASGNEISKYEWTKKSGPAAGTIVTPNGASTQVKNLVAGTYLFELKVTDNNGLASTATVTVTVKPALMPPVAHAGTDLVIELPTDIITLDASKSTAPSGNIQKYEWTKISGPEAGLITNPVNVSTQVTGLTVGTYEWQLIVTDDNGLTGQAIVKTVVKPAPLPPVAVAGLDIKLIAPNNITTLDGSASHAPSGSIKTYNWQQVAGDGAATIEQPNNAVTQISNLKTGEYTFELTVTDNNNAISKDRVTVRVIQLPVANAGADLNITLPVNKVVLDGSASVIPVNAGATYIWTKISGPGNVTLLQADQLQAEATGLTEGVYEFQLDIKDVYNHISTDRVVVTVLPQPQPPVANAGENQTITLPVQQVNLDGRASTVVSGPASYTWKKVSGPQEGRVDEPLQSQTTASHLTQGMYEFELTVTDANGLTSTASITVTVLPQPLPPVVDAGKDITIALPQNTVILSGSAEGQIKAYEWRQVSGPSEANIASPTTAETEVTGLVEGLYKFELKVTDSNGLFSVAQLTVTVNAAPQPPVADAGVAQTITLPDNEVMLDASGSSAPAGIIVKYEWIQLSGPSEAVIANPNDKSTNVSGLTEGLYKFQVRVTDSNGATSTATVNITVKAALKPPVANAGNAQTITLPENSIVLDASKSTAPSGTIKLYEWSFVSGPDSVIIDDANSNTTTVRNLKEGVYLFAVKVVDNHNGISTATVTVTVKAAPQPPVANAGSAQTISLPVSSVLLDAGNSSAPAGTIVTYAWKQVAGPAVAEIVSPENITTVVQWLKEGEYEFELTVTDNNGNSATATVTVAVKAAPLPPVAKAGKDQVIVLPQSSVILNASQSVAPSGTITSYQWSKSSGATGITISNAAGMTVTVTGLTEGVFIFKLVVTDNHGATASDSIKVTVLPQPKPPVAMAGADQVIILPEDQVLLNGVGSSSENSTITTFSWKQVSGPSLSQIHNSNTAIATAGSLQTGEYEFELTVTDKNGLSAKDTLLVKVKPMLMAPVAVVGSNITITLPQHSVNLDGSGSYDADGNIVSYEWIKLSGPVAGDIQVKSEAVYIVTGLAQGNYVFELMVTDNDGLTDRKKLSITVYPAPALPVANAGIGKTVTLPINEVILDGSKSTAPDGTIISYQWKQVDGPAEAVIATSNQAATAVTGFIAGNYVFELEVIDNHGGRSQATVTIVVNNAPVPPVANAGNNQTITLPVNTVTLSAEKSSATGTLVNYEWTKLSGPSGGNLTSPQGITTRVTALTEGEYQYQLKITDNNGLSSLAMVNITVKPAPLPPVADAGSGTVINLPVNNITLDGSKSFGVSAPIVKYEWTQTAGPGVALITNPNAVTTRAETLQEGVYSFMLKVTDGLGKSASAVVIVEVKPAPLKAPVAIAGNGFTVQLPLSSFVVDGSASYAQDNANIVQYNWTKISGPNPTTLVNANSAKATVVATEPGSYLFRLTVTDNRGLKSSDEILVTVLPQQHERPLPVAYAGENVVLVLPENSTELNGWASYSEYGEIVSYQWKMLQGPSTPRMDNPQSDVVKVEGLEAGEYEFELVVTDDEGKEGSARVKIVVNNAGGKQDFSSDVRIYPNPLQSVGTLDIRSAVKGRTIVDIYNSGAKRVLRKEFIKDGFNGNEQIDFSKLPRGVYFVEIIIDYQYRRTIKVIRN